MKKKGRKTAEGDFEVIVDYKQKVSHVKQI